MYASKAVLNYLVLIFILMNTSEVKCIKCFQCNSNNNSACLNLEMIGKNPLYPTDCLGDYGGVEPFCRKITLQLLDKSKNPESRIIRSCGWVRYKNQCYNADNEDHNERVCQCFEDGCNSGETGKLFKAYLMLPIFLIVQYILLSILRSL